MFDNPLVPSFAFHHLSLPLSISNSTGLLAKPSKKAKREENDSSYRPPHRKSKISNLHFSLFTWQLHGFGYFVPLIITKLHAPCRFPPLVLFSRQASNPPGFVINPDSSLFFSWLRVSFILSNSLASNVFTVFLEKSLFSFLSYLFSAFAATSVILFFHQPLFFVYFLHSGTGFSLSFIRIITNSLDGCLLIAIVLRY